MITHLYNYLGEKQKALDYYNQALPILRTEGNHSGEAISCLFNFINDFVDHTDITIENRRLEVKILGNIGLVYYALGEKKKALDYYNQALLLSKVAGDISEGANTLTSIGAVYSDLGKKQKALDYYLQALLSSKVAGDRSVEANTLTGIGNVYSDLGEKQKALDYYNQALSLRRAISDRSGESLSLFHLAYLQRSEGQLYQALTNIEASIAIIEDLRLKIINPDLRTSYFSSVQNYYQFYIDLLMQLHKLHPNQGYDIRALEASESARARGLLDLLTEAKANIKEGVSPQLLEQERSIQQQLDTLEKQRIELLSQNKPVPDSLTQDIKTLNQQYSDNKDQIRQTSPRYAALTQPKPLKLAEIQQLLDDNTIILEYSLGSEQSYLWLITKNSFTSYEIPKKAAEIEQLVKDYNTFLAFNSNVASEIQSNKIALDKTGAKIQQILLTPVADKIKTKRLVIVADGALQLIPFAALPSVDGQQQPLLVSNEILNLPSASTLGLIRQQNQGRQTASKTIAILADPVFSPDDPRLSNKAINTPQPSLGEEILKRGARENNIQLARLIHTKEEAEAIIKLVPSQQGQLNLSFAANLPNATNPELVNYRIIHLATHGLIDSVDPKRSGVVFSLVNEKGEPENGYLRLEDIFNLKLGADLVVLSACQTGLGKEIKGEGLVGLTRGFMYAGAPRLVVSLWSVDDQATSILMSLFYTGIIKQGLTPAQSLRQAQQDMMKNPKYESPYYWAPFILQGDWK